MKPYQERVIQERRELGERLDKLWAFITGEEFKTLPEAEQRRLEHQRAFMRGYATILDDRIQNFQ